MAGNTFGKIFRITTWGESHGKALGVVVDGVPAGLPVSERIFRPFWTAGSRRKPLLHAKKGSGRGSDPFRRIEGKTTGTPISLLIPNTSSAPPITVRSLPITDRAMPITPLTRNMASGLPGRRTLFRPGDRRKGRGRGRRVPVFRPARHPGLRLYEKHRARLLRALLRRRDPQ